MGRHDCFVNEIVGGNEDVKYKIQDETVIDNVDYGKLFEVHFSRYEWLVDCVCHMFEFKGILCRHELYVLSHESVSVVHRRYILDQWRKDIKRKHTYVSKSYDDVHHGPVLDRYEKLHKLAIGVLEVGVEFVNNFNANTIIGSSLDIYAKSIFKSQTE